MRRFFLQLRHDAAIGTPLPAWVTNSTNYNSSTPLANQIIHWEPLRHGWGGFALLVDDVERYAVPALNFSMATLNASIPHFFRLAVSGWKYDMLSVLTFVLVYFTK